MGVKTWAVHDGLDVTTADVDDLLERLTHLRQKSTIKPSENGVGRRHEFQQLGMPIRRM